MNNMKIRIVKLNRPSKYMFNIVSVDKDDKHKYFIANTKIYKHIFKQLIPYTDCDYIEVFDDESTTYGMFSPITKKDTPIRVLRKD